MNPRPLTTPEQEQLPRVPFVRAFETGATRDSDDGKLDYEAFLSPAVLEAYAAYMHQHRRQPDGQLRPGDNWQKGIPQDQYAKSLIRHTIQFWKLHRGLATVDEKGNAVTARDALCAIIFNAMGYLHEALRTPPAMYEALKKTPPLLANVNANAINTVADGLGYKLLAVGDTVQVGDEYFNANKAVWHETLSPGICVTADGYVYRRKLTP